MKQKKHSNVKLRQYDNRKKVPPPHSQTLRIDTQHLQDSLLG